MENVRRQFRAAADAASDSDLAISLRECADSADPLSALRRSIHVLEQQVSAVLLFAREPSRGTMLGRLRTRHDAAKHVLRVCESETA